MKQVIGIDLGGTNIRGGLVSPAGLTGMTSQKINAQARREEVLRQMFEIIDNLMTDSVEAIGVGVPGPFEASEGIVYDVVNIPSWKDVPLGKTLKERYHLPVYINNDANCFALAEFHYGKGRGNSSMVGLTIGTGLGSGIIIQKKLFSGSTGGAGEFGMSDYLDKCYEYYASGQFFQNVHNVDGEVVFKQAAAGDSESLAMYAEMGAHLGNAIKMIMYALDIELIVLGGSVRHAYPFFSNAMWKQIGTFAFQRAARQLKIDISELQDAGVLGAASLAADASL